MHIVLFDFHCLRVLGPPGGSFLSIGRIDIAVTLDVSSSVIRCNCCCSST